MDQTKKSEILKAAKECFNQYGYKKTTLDDIGSLVGLNKASLYYYFENKEAIFVNIVLREFKEFITSLQKLISKESNCTGKIITYFSEKVKYWHQGSNILPLITEINPIKLKQSISSGQEIYNEIKNQEISFLSEILQNCIQNGNIVDCDVDKISRLLLAITDGIKENYIDLGKLTHSPKNRIEELEKDIQMALKIFMNGLGDTSENIGGQKR